MRLPLSLPKPRLTASTQQIRPNPKVSSSDLLDTLQEILDRIRRAGKPPASQLEAGKRIEKLLDDEDELKRFREWVATGDSMAASQGQYSSEVYGDLKSQLVQRASRTRTAGLLKRLHLRTPIECASFLAELSLLCLHTLVGVHGPFLLELVLFELTRHSQGVLEHVGLVPSDYAGERWPFYLGWGRGDVRRPWIKDLMQELHR